MKPWAEHVLFAGSLRRFLLLWLLGGLVLVVASITLWQAMVMHLRLAQAQDERLAAALATLVQSVLDERTLLIDAPAYAATRPPDAAELRRCPSACRAGTRCGPPCFQCTRPPRRWRG